VIRHPQKIFSSAVRGKFLSNPENKKHHRRSTRLVSFGGHTSRFIVCIVIVVGGEVHCAAALQVFHPAELVGRTFLIDSARETRENI